VPAPEAPRGVATSTKIQIVVLIVGSNLLGAAILTGLAVWVLPLGALVADVAGAVRLHLALFLGYAPPAALIAVAWGWWWLRVPAPPGPGAPPPELERFTARVRQVVLRAPIRLSLVQAVPWTVGLVVFAAVDTTFGGAFAIAVGAVIALGAIGTVTVAYCCSVLVLRREVARIAVPEPATPRRVPGVAVRSLGAWLMGTGVGLAGLAFTGVSALVYDEYYTVARLGVVVVVLSVGAFLVGLLVTALSSVSTAASVLALRDALTRVRHGELDVTVAVSDTTELGQLQSGFNTMVDGLRERDRVRELFGRQVGRDVAIAAIGGELELGGEVREVAVLFVDLVGSTRLAATRPPTEVVAHLNRFFAEVVDVVSTEGGWINKFVGDGAVAVFGAPGSLDDPAGCALRTARVLAARLRGAPVPIQAGIGVSAGEVVAGNIGDERRYEYTVIGDPVNEAARLSSLAKEHDERVAVSRAALLRAAEEEADRWRVVGERRLRGRVADTVVAVPLADAAPAQPTGSVGPGSSTGA
jgi:adenylate cyclase